MCVFSVGVMRVVVVCIVRSFKYNTARIRSLWLASARSSRYKGIQSPPDTKEKRSLNHDVASIIDKYKLNNQSTHERCS